MPNPTTTTGKPRRTRLALALAATAVLAALAAGPAQAHDSLTSTSPAKDTTVTTAPAAVALTLSEPPTDAAGLNTSVIKVTDSTGATISDGNVTVSGATISTTVAKGANGPVTVLWRAVSSDGHPIEGTYTYTVQEPAPTSTGTTPPATATTEAPASAQPAAAESPRPDDSNGPLVAGLAALVIAIVAAGFFFSQRSRKNQP